MTPHRYTTLPDWFTIEPVGEGIFLINEPRYRADYRCNIYLIKGRTRDLVIDTGLGLGNLSAFLKDKATNPLLLASHAHYDHLGGNFEFAERLAHPAEADQLANPTRENTYADPILRTEDFSVLPWDGWRAEDWRPVRAAATKLVDDGDAIDLGDRRYEVLHTPGHSWGSHCLWDQARNEMFCVDTIYDGEIFDQLSCSHIPTYVKSMARLSKYPVKTAFPGHGPVLTGDRFREIAEGYVRDKG
jgi:glyoxylase-like metal-dependent hydrolase (beta-lactamase superfamily II)